MNEFNERLSKAGVNITTKTFTAKLEAAQADARAKADAVSGTAKNRRAADIIENIFNQTTVILVGLIVVLIGLIVPMMLYAEWDGVYSGLTTFGIDGFKGGVLAFVLVASVFALMFIRTQLDTNRSTRYRFSLRLVLDDFLYTLGLPRGGWAKQEQRHGTQYEELTTTIRVMLWSIVGFSVMGRLAPVIATEEMTTRNIVDGLVYLVQTTSLVMFIGALLSGVMSIGLFLGLHWSLDFLATSFERLTGGLSFGAAHRDPQTVYEELMREWYERLITQAESKQRLTASPTPSNDSLPSVEPPTVSE